MQIKFVLKYIYVAQFCTVYNSVCKWKLPLQAATIQTIVRTHLGSRMPLHSTGRQAQRINQCTRNLVPGIKSYERLTCCSFILWHISKWCATNRNSLQRLEKQSMNTHELLWRNRTRGSKQKVHQSEHKPTSQTSVVSGHELRAIAAKQIFLIFLHLANIARLKPKKNWIIVRYTTSYFSSFFALHVRWSESDFVHPCFCSRPG